MEPQRSCQDCIQKHDCQSIYEKMGNYSGSSVVLKVVFAFLLPLIVFIVSLAISGSMLSKAIDIEKLHIALSFVLALLATFIWVLLTRVIYK